MATETIPSRLMDQAQQQGSAPGYFEKAGEAWVPTSWSAYADRVRRAARALIALGFESGDKVCILGFNRPEWVILDVAAMAAGGAAAGIYVTCSPSEVQYIVDHSEARLVLVEDEEQWHKVEQELPRLPKLERVVTMRGAPAIDHDIVLDWQAFLSLGDDVPEADLDARLEALQADGLATLIYTSGTTGPPKAVMLSHRNLTFTADTAARLAGATRDDCTISYLPLSHIAEQLFTIHGAISVGYPVYYAQSLEQLPDHLKEVRPTLIFGVPRVWEKMVAAVRGKMEQATGIKARLAAWAMKVGQAGNHVRNQGMEPGLSLGLQFAVANRLVFSKAKAAMGFDRGRVHISAAAPIGKDVLEFMAGLDIVIQEVYGQSEDTGPATFNRAGAVRFGSVGQPLPGTECRIADDGEVLLRGDHIFLGYYKEPELTAETLQDGWLHTGDLGRLDDDDFLYITGRKKDIIITSGGKNITPANLEEALAEHPLVSQAVCVGDGRKFVSALLTLVPDAAAEWAERHGRGADGVHTDPELLAELQRHVDEQVNPRFARVEHVRKFAVLPREFTVEEEELTPTMKIKRRVVHEHFAAEIDALYAE